MWLFRCLGVEWMSGRSKTLRFTAEDRHDNQWFFHWRLGAFDPWPFQLERPTGHLWDIEIMSQGDLQISTVSFFTTTKHTETIIKVHVLYQKCDSPRWWDVICTVFSCDFVRKMFIFTKRINHLAQRGYVVLPKKSRATPAIPRLAFVLLVLLGLASLTVKDVSRLFGR